MSLEGHKPLAYRADIDGLRAIAVLLVVLDHLEFRHFEGGYIGVDVFFVISGYLIGASLIADFKGRGFSLASFYERRIRRILPALLAVLIVTSVLAYHYLLPGSLVDYSKSGLAALASVSNFFFWHQSGYFDGLSENKPLLHTWSLAVEEQFYLIFPLVLFLVFRWFPRALRAVLWTIAALTFLLSIWFVYTDSVTAFFWSPLRAWELLAGVLVSQYGWPALRSRGLREFAAVAGLLMVMLPGLRYTSTTPFPGLAAFLPCFGTALIIACGQVGSSSAGRLISTRPFRFFGMISYSLYLWHWPILVFQRLGFLLTSKPLWERNTKLLTLLVSVVAATLSWWWIETPFRKGRFKPARRPLFLLTGSVTLLLAVAALFAVRSEGAPNRFPAEVVRLGHYTEYNTDVPWRLGTCFLLSDVPFERYSPSTCLTPAAGRKNYLLFGDSTAAQLYPGLLQMFPEAHIEQATAGGCHPYRDHSDVANQYRSNCAKLWEYIQTVYLPAQRPDAVILASAWLDSSVENLGAEIASFQQRGIPVVLVGPEINFDLSMPFLVSVEIQRHSSRQQAAEHLFEHMNQDKIRLDAVMKRMAHDTWHVRYVSYYDELCQPGDKLSAAPQWETSNGCPLFLPSGEPVIYDNHHFTLAASTAFAAKLRAQSVLP